MEPGIKIMGLGTIDRAAISYTEHRIIPGKLSPSTQWSTQLVLPVCVMSSFRFFLWIARNLASAVIHVRYPAITSGWRTGLGHRGDAGIDGPGPASTGSNIFGTLLYLRDPATTGISYHSGTQDLSNRYGTQPHHNGARTSMIPP